MDEKNNAQPSGDDRVADSPKKKRKGKANRGVLRPNNSSTSPRYIKAAQRRREALQLRLQSYTYRQIASHLKVSCSQIERDIGQALAEHTAEPAAQVLKFELARLDEMATAYYTNACEGDLPAAQMMLRIIEMRGRLLGLFDKERIAGRISITDGAGGGDAPRALAVEFIIPSGARLTDLDALDAPPSLPQPAQPSPTRIQPHPDDLVLDKVQPSAFKPKRGGFEWS